MSKSGTYSRVSGMTILFAERDADTRDAYQSTAVSAGFSVELAANGYEAIALANVFLPNLTVLDAGLADLDGVEVARRLRANSRTCAIPIVFVSRNDSQMRETALRAIRCEGHLVRPFPYRDLIVLARVLAIRHRAPAPAINVGRSPR